MTERTIQNALFSDLYKKGYGCSCPNYIPNNWPYEADMFALTKAGRFVEFEIKISKADFKVDARKGPSERDKQYYGSFPPDSKTFKNFDPRTKHERIAAGDENGPSRFYYVVPDKMIGPADVPLWAGLIYAYERHGRISFLEQKPAPFLHRKAADQRVILHMTSVFHYRYWALRKGLRETETP